MRLLVLEDQTDLREAVAGRLRSHGHAVDEAGDLAEAESFVRSYAYDAFVLDRMLPDGDALDTLQRWRERGIANVALDEDVIRISLDRLQRVQVAGIGQHVEVDDLDPFPNRREYEITANKTGTAGHKPSGHLPLHFLLRGRIQSPPGGPLRPLRPPNARSQPIRGVTG